MPEILAFDVFGTVVDWRSSIVREGKAFGEAQGIEFDWEQFADEWRGLYGPWMNKVRTGELGWTRLDDLHRMSLEALLEDHDFPDLDPEVVSEFSLAWHRLDPWPDAAEGLRLLGENFITLTLSNGNVSLMVDLARWGGLRWDCILGAEHSRRYKPDPNVYLDAARAFDREPGDVMMVATHVNDLLAAQKCGLKTAYVYRDGEYGGRAKPAPEPSHNIDIIAGDFIDLSRQLDSD